LLAPLVTMPLWNGALSFSLGRVAHRSIADGAAVAVSVPFLAANGSLTDPVGERQCRLLATVDVYRTARVLIRRHGDGADAPIHAAMRAR
jgi:hypothetical protein